MPVDFGSIKAQLQTRAEQALNEFVDELADEIRQKAPVGKDRRKPIGLTGVTASTSFGSRQGPMSIREVEAARRGYGRFSFTPLAYQTYPGLKRPAIGSMGMAPENIKAGYSVKLSVGAQQLLEGRARRVRRGTARSHQPGALKRSIYSRHAVIEGGKLVAKVGAGVRYAQAVDHGARGNERNRGFFSSPLEHKRNRIGPILAGKLRRIG